ncbi:TVP38/TMEM64 family protein [Paenibacillus xylaniclasticus]|uniref:TVP38/TMEM64 family protein n=1 Tax=Paenibacillus xylaniclasticus TaxID=588083 RepID=UPI000FD84858|nr:MULTISPECIES: TVP38/TMEM64 family protein [Paenibacillus]GFN31568.1 putative membrane protein YhjE [Paenibacillus curdlanolyticus]
MNELQDWLTQIKALDLEHIERTLRSYKEFGPLPGLLMPIAEALIPALPLIVIVAANVNIYGLWYGFLLSWLGVTIGASIVFWIARKLGRRLGQWFRRRLPKSQKFFNWIENKGFTPLFLLACFPFTPSALINVVAGLSTLPFRTFLIATLLGKSVMIFSISIVSADISNLAREPWRIVVLLTVLAVMWFGGKQLESRYQLK